MRNSEVRRFTLKIITCMGDSFKNQCRYLCQTSTAFYCAKTDPRIKSLIDEEVELYMGSMGNNADEPVGDNCAGLNLSL